MEVGVSNLSSFLVSLGKLEPNWSRFGMWDAQDIVILRICRFFIFFYPFVIFSGKCNHNNCLLLFDGEGENCVTACLKLSLGNIVVNPVYNFI